MLSNLTYFIILISMGGALWLAFYLFSRGFPSSIAMRAVLSLFAMAIFFWLTYNNFFQPQTHLNYLKAILLNLATASWYSLTFKFLEKNKQQKHQILEKGIYTLVLITLCLLFIYKPEFARRYNNEFYIAELDTNISYIFYSITQLTLSIGLFFNLLNADKIRLTPQGCLLRFASIFPLLAVFYGIFSVIFPQMPLPRIIQDLFVFTGFFLLGISILKHQSLLERRTVFQDFPLIFFSIASLSSIYILFAIYFFQIGIDYFANVIGFVVITHSLYDLAREFLERYRTKQENTFRKQVLKFTPQESQTYLQDTLELFCNQIKAEAGVVAVRKADKFIISATNNSLAVGSEVFHQKNEDTATERFNGDINNIQWTASIFEAKEQIAFVGIGNPINRMDYSRGELDLLQEFADYVGLILSMDVNLKKNKDTQYYQNEIYSATQEIVAALMYSPEEKIIKMTEDGLRKFPDYVKLGQSELAGWLKINATSHIDRGKKLQNILREGVETLCPAGTRPEEPLPRNWYNYVVLNDAYIKGVMNREVMARLYISEGTFNRTRRNALRGIARWLEEKNKNN